MLTKFVSIGSYSPKIRTVGTLVTSTKVFSLIISANAFDHAPQKILYLEILDSVLTIPATTMAAIRVM